MPAERIGEIFRPEARTDAAANDAARAVSAYQKIGHELPAGRLQPPLAFDEIGLFNAHTMEPRPGVNRPMAHHPGEFLPRIDREIIARGELDFAPPRRH